MFAFVVDSSRSLVTTMHTAGLHASYLRDALTGVYHKHQQTMNELDP